MSNTITNAPDHYDLLIVAQRRQGIGRLKIGALLYLLKENGTWSGRGGSSFRRFLIEHGFEPRAAQQCMKVSKCFVIDYSLHALELEKIATASMRNLTLAATIASPENIDRIIDILASLPRPEANEELLKLAPRIGKAPEVSPINKILDQMGNLTLDQRAELYRKIGASRHTQIPLNTM